jgi:MtN3 and saliva related transmembrane protein
MKTSEWAAAIGLIAGFCTTIAFVPQVVKIWRQGGHDLSYGMLALYQFGVLLWLWYGFLLHSREIILANGATAILVGLATILKAATASKSRARRFNE